MNYPHSSSKPFSFLIPVRSTAKVLGERRGIFFQFLLFLFLVVFLMWNLHGSNITTVVAGIILCAVSFATVNLSGKYSIGRYPLFLPVIFYCIGVLVFHFYWRANLYSGWYERGVYQEFVAYALLLAGLAISSLGFGAWVATPFPPQGIDNKTQDGNLHFLVGLVYLLAGWTARMWSLKNQLAGFYVAAFGIDFSLYKNPFLTLVLASRELVGIGQILLLVLFLNGNRVGKHQVQKRFGRYILIGIFLLSFSFDLVFRLQSAARGTLLIGFVPVLLTYYVFGHRKLVYLSIMLGVILYVGFFYPLAEVIRYDPSYPPGIQMDGIYRSDFGVLSQLPIINDAAIHKSLSRFNQTSLMAFALQRQAQGQAPFGSQPYWEALSTLVPRLVLTNREDQKISYDFLTGYSKSFHGYNNWGVHTEALVNFGILGVLVVMVLVGFVWEKTYLWLLRFEFPIGWAIISNILLPSIFRAGEYGFLASLISVYKPLLAVVFLSIGMVLVFRIAQMAGKREASEAGILEVQ